MFFLLLIIFWLWLFILLISVLTVCNKIGPVAKFANSFQGFHSRKLQNGKFSDDDDVPSAPPFGGSTQEIKQASERGPTPKMNGTAKAADLPGVKNTADIKPEDKSANGKSEQFVRSVFLLFLKIFFMKTFKI